MSFDEQPDGDLHGECAAEIDRLTLRWTSDAPTNEGWYWIRHIRGGEELRTISEVRNFYDGVPANPLGNLRVFEGDGWTPVDHPVFLSCGWSGPIEPPIEKP